ncbi:MAG: Smr/MutS family protein [Paracoccaceae bacterium]|nr:Smr/MutS family protein [Paracoccaceae bacterium]
MSGKKHRGLSEEDRMIWDQVRRTAKALHPKPNRPVVRDAFHEKPQKKTAQAPQPLSDFRIGEKASYGGYRHSQPQPLSDQLARAPLAIDKKRFGKMKRGKMAPEARIDLHGMTLAEAHPALMNFIFGAHGEGCRLVLVITGKGKSTPDHGPIPARPGVLRHHVPQWLHMAPLRSVVLQVVEAHARHGGSGAFYVYLRRPGK